MKSTSLGCLGRRNKNYSAVHEELRSQVSRGVNGHRFDIGSLPKPERFFVRFIWTIFGAGIISAAVIASYLLK